MGIQAAISLSDWNTLYKAMNDAATTDSLPINIMLREGLLLRLYRFAFSAASRDDGATLGLILV